MGSPGSEVRECSFSQQQTLLGSQSQVENVQLGTNIVISDVMSSFKHFLYEFKDKDTEGDETESIYIRKITQLLEKEMTILNLDLADIRSFSETQRIYDQIVQTPGIVINILEQVLNEVVQEVVEGTHLKPQNIHLRLYNMEKKSSMRDLSTDNIEGLVCIEGMITRVGDLLPDLRIATFHCSVCNYSKQVNRDGHRIVEPERCPNCHSPNSMQVDHNGGLFADKQLIKMQEVPDMVPQGETPQSVSLYVYDDLFDSVKPGDKVEVTGIYRAIPIRISRKKSTVKDVFRTFIDVIHFRRQVEGRFIADDEKVDENRMVEEEENQLNEELKRLSERPTIYEDLVASIAPSIW